MSFAEDALERQRCNSTIGTATVGQSMIQNQNRCGLARHRMQPNPMLRSKGPTKGIVETCPWAPCAAGRAFQKSVAQLKPTTSSQTEADEDGQPRGIRAAGGELPVDLDMVDERQRDQ
jgi:hypothetical protein